MIKILPRWLFLGALPAFFAFLFLFLPAHHAHADSVYDCTFGISEHGNFTADSNDQYLEFIITNIGTASLSHLLISDGTGTDGHGDGSIIQGSYGLNPGWTDETTINNVAFGGSLLLTTEAIAIASYWHTSPGSAMVNFYVYAIADDSTEFQCTFSPSGALDNTVLIVPDIVGGAYITPRDIQLISLGIALFLGFIFVKQFRWRL